MHKNQIKIVIHKVAPNQTKQYFSISFCTYNVLPHCKIFATQYYNWSKLYATDLV